MQSGTLRLTLAKLFKFFIQDDLHWNSHLSKLEKKIESCHWTINKVKTSNYLARTLYDSLFNSHLIYVCEIYRFRTKMIHYFNELQEKTLCIINFKRRNTPRDQLFLKKKILKISCFIK